MKTLLNDDTDPVPDTLLDGTRTTDGESPLGVEDNVTELAGMPGPWMLRLPHFRLGRGALLRRRDPDGVLRRSRRRHRRSERRAGPGRQHPSHLIWTELRTAAADELWLSPAYRRDVVIIHFTWHNHPDEVTALVARIEAALQPFGARPHWGKVHGFDRAAMEQVHPRLGDARAVFERLDPDGRFTNAHLERVGVREPG
ncbi:D-arabinono-1,4-lactone oxidase [Microbacterium yannicii]|uniref:D-arabinono-1,4-lactone oxidase n=1 Tax=Microbacterium yannicii TaxID=671622 RepID=UPI0002F34744|nr:D-arabinono-1,4-lactone oxidase [Microbacterium yannicii]